ncbi:MAG TPA: TDP-N-acetylfucosamine:lipid II N-acetylfucosaminyltransferase, partial [Galbitalea sp.]|nr:TDP-N-acetylfucosamine:lipid II N-acetylfucosaminyltransferase [Galbitalea sp.]
MPPRRSLRIVHIGRDSQFLQFAANVFESVAPGANEYIVVGASSSGTLHNPIAHGKVTVVPSSPQGVCALLTRRPECDLIVAHSMSVHAAAAFLRAKSTTATMWSGWGFDYYGTDAAKSHELLAPLTRELETELTRSARGRRSLPRRALSRVWSEYERRLIRRAAARSTYFSAPVPVDEQVFRSRFPQFRGRYSQLNYASLEETFTTASRAKSKSGGVLIGNSASPTNNHLDAFELLACQDLGERRVIVPLSYGSAAYRDVIVQRGTELFGANFLPLIERMPLDEYNEVVGNCDTIIMNQRRQQALGNIGTALYAGAGIFLDEVNPLYGFLKQQGVSVRP